MNVSIEPRAVTEELSVSLTTWGGERERGTPSDVR